MMEKVPEMMACPGQQTGLHHAAHRASHLDAVLQLLAWQHPGSTTPEAPVTLQARMACRGLANHQTCHQGAGDAACMQADRPLGTGPAVLPAELGRRAWLATMAARTEMQKRGQ